MDGGIGGGLVHFGLEKAEILIFIHYLLTMYRKGCFESRHFGSHFGPCGVEGVLAAIVYSIMNESNLVLLSSWFIFALFYFSLCLQFCTFLCAKYFIHHMDDVSSSNNRVLFSLLKPKISAFFGVGGFGLMLGVVVVPKRKKLLKLKI